MWTPYCQQFRSVAKLLAVALLLASAAPGRTAEPSDAERLLQTAQQAMTAGRWEESARALAAAEKLPASTEVESRVAAFRRELFMVVRLDEIRNDYPVDAEGLDDGALVIAYRKAFAQYGLEPEKPTEEMKNRARLSPIRASLIGALDQWVQVIPSDRNATRCQLLDFANGLDDSTLRRAVRVAVWKEDQTQLVRFAKEAEVAALSADTLLMLTNM